MMRYRFSYTNPNTHFIEITLSFVTKEADVVVKLPAWRPGRYQIQNFAKNIRHLEAKDESRADIPTRKISKDSWQLGNVPGEVHIQYEYYAFEMDAGNSWLDYEQLYVNFINCALYVEELLPESCELTLDIPAGYKVATGLEEASPRHFTCESYYRLVDSPLIASASLRQVTYAVAGHLFHIWIQGKLDKTDEALISDFRPFTELQMAVMGGFPCTG